MTTYQEFLDVCTQQGRMEKEIEERISELLPRITEVPHHYRISLEYGVDTVYVEWTDYDGDDYSHFNFPALLLDMGEEEINAYCAEIEAKRLAAAEAKRLAEEEKARRAAAEVEQRERKALSRLLVKYGLPTKGFEKESEDARDL